MKRREALAGPPPRKPAITLRSVMEALLGGGAAPAAASAATAASERAETDRAPGNWQLLAANSFLFGTTNLLVLNLPDGWTLRNGYQQPEVDARQLVGSVNWATMASANYHVRPPGAAKPIELWVRIQPKPRPASGDTTMVSGHQGSSTLYRDAKGAEHLLLRWSCPKSGRAIELEAQGPGQPEAPLADLLAALQRCQCHTD